MRAVRPSRSRSVCWIWKENATAVLMQREIRVHSHTPLHTHKQPFTPIQTRTFPYEPKHIHKHPCVHPYTPTHTHTHTFTHSFTHTHPRMPIHTHSAQYKPKHTSAPHLDTHAPPYTPERTSLPLHHAWTPMCTTACLCNTDANAKFRGGVAVGGEGSNPIAKNCGKLRKICGKIAIP